MVNNSSSEGLLSGLPGMLRFAVVVVLLLAFAVLLLFGLGVCSLRSGVSVVGAELNYPDNLILIVDSCHKAPGVSTLKETDVEVQVRVVASSHPFLRGGDDCQDIVSVPLGKPLGNRTVIDMSTGKTVNVVPIIR